MANPEQLEIIKRGPDAWNEWRKEHTRARIDFIKATLSTFSARANLRGVNLTEADLRGAFLRNANLLEAHLTRADLTGAYVRGTNLIGSNLIEANLTDADLRSARLRNADLRNAKLTGADLTSADLAGADLSGALLFGTNFTKAHFDGTNFSEVRLARTIFGDVDLSAALGLQSAIHFGPSIIGIDSFYQSQGKVSEAFLRGSGIPEDVINLIPKLTEQPIQFYSCFISYSHADKPFARRLYDGLQGRGIRCWLDEKQVLPGHNIYDEVDRGIRLWDKVLLCCSKHSLSSWWVDNEINTAFAKEQQLQKDLGKKALALIPLDLDGYLFEEWNDGKAQQVKSRLAADFKGWEHDNAKFEEQFERVVKTLQTDDGREAPPTPRL